MSKFSKDKTEVAAKAMLVLGLVAMVIGLVAGWTVNNWFTIPCGVVVLAGAALYVKALRRQSRY